MEKVKQFAFRHGMEIATMVMLLFAAFLSTLVGHWWPLVIIVSWTLSLAHSHDKVMWESFEE